MKKGDLPWVFVAALLISATIIMFACRRSDKPSVRLQQKEEGSEPVPAPSPPQNDVFYRRYHHWTSPTTDQTTLTATIDECERECTSDANCYGVSHDTMTNRCGKLVKGNFDATTGLLGEYVDTSSVITSMKDRSLKADHMDCFGPYKREHPNRISTAQCPRSREAAVNAYFKDIPALSVFGEMLPGGTESMLKVQMRAR